MKRDRLIPISFFLSFNKPIKTGWFIINAPESPLSKFRSQHLLLFLAAMAAVALFLIMLAPFLEAILLAGIFSLGLYSWLERIYRRFSRPGSPTRRALILAFAIIMVSISSLFAVSLLNLYNNFLGDNKDQTYKTIQQVTDYGTLQLQTAKPYLNSWLKVFGINDLSYDSALKSLPQKIFGASAHFVATIPSFLIQAVVFSAMMLFFLMSHRGIYRLAMRFKSFSAYDVNQLIKILKISSYESIMTNAMVGLFQAVVLTLGALAVGFYEWSLIFTTALIFSFVPVIGASSIAFGLGLVALMTGQTGAAVAMFAIGCITGTADNILRSYLMSQTEKQTNALLCFVVIIGAVYVFGFSGLFIGPFVLNVCVQMLPLVLPRDLPHSETSSENLKNASLRERQI